MSNYNIVPETAQEEQHRKQLADEYLHRELNLTNEQLEFIDTKLSSKLWRMNHIYHIRTKEGQLQRMRLNHSQEKVLTQYRHNKKIILKSRQQGISTLYLAYNLDDCLFKAGISVGIQSYGQDEAEKLSKRAELMWEKLDPEIKELLGIKLVSNNSKGMTFSNGSILKIGNFRGDTIQALHVSELAKIAKRYPEKAKELKTGAFQAVSTKSKITVESTAEGPMGLFYDIWQKAVMRVDAVGHDGLTPLDFQPIFLSWIEDPDCTLEYEYPQTEELTEYLKTLEKAGIDTSELTEHQLNWLGAKLEELGDDFNQEYPATPEMAFAAQIEGMYFRKQYKRLMESDRVTKAPYNPDYGVNVSFDLGVNDETVLLFAQLIDGQPYLIDEYHSTDNGIVHYSEVMKQKPYVGNYEKIIFPHDIEVRDFSTGRTRLETFRREGWSNTVTLPKLSFQDSIEAARQFIDILVIDPSLENTLLAIQNYRKKYDRTLGVFLGTDVHDIHSNYAASLRYMAQGLGYYKVRNSKPKTLEQQYYDWKDNSYTGFAV